MKRLITVYRSAKVSGLYVFTERGKALDELPDELIGRVGELTIAVEFALTPERSLARSDPAAVTQALDEQGFYLQLPPAPGSEHAADEADP